MFWGHRQTRMTYDSLVTFSLFFFLVCYFRPYWRCYYSNTDAIIYVVDSADKDRIGISKDELLYMLREEELAGAILVVLANKQDMEGCLSVAEVHQALGLDQLKNRTFQVRSLISLQ